MNRKVLEKALAKACRLVNGTHVPAARVVKLAGCGEGIMMMATDLESTLVLTLPATEGVVPSAEVCVNPRKVASIVRAMPSGLSDVPMFLAPDELMMGNARLKPEVAVEDYPAFPSLNGKASYQVTFGDGFQAAWDYVRPVVSKEPTMQALNGVLFDFARGNLVASDGKRLHVASFAPPGPGKEVLVAPLIPDLLMPLSMEVPVDTKDLSAVFTSQEGVAVTRAMEAKFPDYSNVIPKKRKHKVVVWASRLLEVLQEVSSVASREAPSCKLSTYSGVITLAAEDDSGLVLSGEVPAEGYSKEVQLNLNPYFLRDAIFPSWEKVTLQFDDGEVSMIVSGEEPGALAVVMPLR